MNDIYLNHAGTSWPKPPIVAEAVREAIHRPPEEWPNQFAAAQQTIADYFGIDRPEQLLFTPGCTSALAVGIGDARVTPGQRVLTSHWEHQAIERPVQKLRSAGISVDRIPVVRDAGTMHDGGPLDLDWLEQALAQGDVALVAMTAVCNVTGEILPYPEVIRLAHQYDAMVLLDAAQAVGWERFDLPRLGADIVAFGGHKGLQAPWGIGGLYVSEQARLECTSAACQLPATNANAENPAARPGYCDVGSVDYWALAGLHAAITRFREQDPSALLAAGRRQIQRIRSALEAITGVRVFGPSAPEKWMPTVAIEVAGERSDQVAERLQACGLTVGSGLLCAPLAHELLGTQTTGVVRISVGVGQADAEIEEAIDRLQRALAVRN